MIARRADTRDLDQRAQLYHGVAIRYRTRRHFDRMRFVRWLSNGRAWIVVFERDGDRWHARPQIIDAGEIAVSSDSYDPPPLPDYLRGPACPDCEAWPLDMHAGGLWYCNSCLNEVSNDDR
jgi:hypothetical protein